MAHTKSPKLTTPTPRVADPNNKARVRRIVTAALAQRPCTAQFLAGEVGIPRKALEHHLAALGQIEVIKFYGSGPSGRWHLAPQRGGVVPALTGGIPVVQLRPNPAWELPTPVHTTLPGGVPYTYQAAPPPRWAVDLPPGTGVISLDNPKLARLGRSAAVKAPSAPTNEARA